METTEHQEAWKTLEREIVIEKTKYHVVSIFTGKTELADAIMCIAKKKLRDGDIRNAG
jgi:hypothetical protein